MGQGIGLECTGAWLRRQIGLVKCCIAAYIGGICGEVGHHVVSTSYRVLGPVPHRVTHSVFTMIP